MSETQEQDIDTTRTREEKLKALVRKDIDPEITAMARRALKRRQEGSS
ncbi:hypothetical protein RBH26_20980 [Natronolimnohabitans sp. A-GB9]|nr:hypothetical protein [Natronolimnohabitans sp. A-GB9]MDQ2052919.1 hypothetical protein [Natronolimnohabitans sp. A-GB9]